VLLGPESVATAELRTIRSGPRIAGSLQAKERATITAEVGGSVLELGAELGDDVQRGQMLAKIEALGTVDAVRSARAAVESAEQSVLLSERQAQRTTGLVKSGAQAQAQLEVDRNAVALARSRREEARAHLTISEKEHRDATVIAPLDGVVSEQSVHKGDVVAKGARLFTVIEPSSMRLEAAIPAIYLPELAVGARVEFEVRGRPGEIFSGQISKIAPAADEVTRQIPVLVSIPNPSRRLLAGLFAEGRIASQTSSGIVLPLDAVELAGTHPSVTVVRNGKAAQVEVEIGVRDDMEELVQIAAGLQAGERVLRGATRNLAPGTPLQLLNAPKTAPTRSENPTAPLNRAQGEPPRPPA
jgi:RND family efflux transporter MFP subunit